MAGYKTLRGAMVSNDYRSLSLGRAEARKLIDFIEITDEHTPAEILTTHLDEAQAEADTEGLNTYIVIEIQGGAL